MHSILAFDPTSPRALSLVLDTARALLLSAAAHESCALLRGRQFGLMCESDTDEDAALFRQAATALGAQVAHIRPSLMALRPPQEIQRTAQMLGRLYDAVDCQGLLPALVQQLALDAGVPVFDSLASAQHPTAKLVGQLAGDASEADKRLVILQAVLMSSVA